MNLTRLMKPAPIECEEDLSKIIFPVIMMPKYDGIRLCICNGKYLTNTLKTIPNRHIQEMLSPLKESSSLGGGSLLDGELLLHNTKDYNAVQSIVMSRDKDAGQIYYCIFDRVLGKPSLEAWYSLRLNWVMSGMKYGTAGAIYPITRPAEFTYAYNVEDILKYEADVLNRGYEGLIFRSPTGPYKQGRSTFKEQYLLKFKRTADAEAEVLDVLEAQSNLNEATIDERGLTKRSSHQDNKVARGMVGSFRCKGLNGKYKGKIFDVSAGSMTEEDRITLWRAWQSGYKLLPITYKYDATRGTNDAPSSARFKAFRKEMA